MSVFKHSSQSGLKTRYFCVRIPMFPHWDNLACSSMWHTKDFSLLLNGRRTAQLQITDLKQAESSCKSRCWQVKSLNSILYTPSIAIRSTQIRKASQCWWTGTNSSSLPSQTKPSWWWTQPWVLYLLAMLGAVTIPRLPPPLHIFHNTSQWFQFYSYQPDASTMFSTTFWKISFSVMKKSTYILQSSKHLE